MHFPQARRIQEQFPAIAAGNLDLLRTVLHTSAEAGDRALAAQIIAYTRDKQAVVPDLVTASRDPSESVRNNAVRALVVMARPSRSP
jgi:HEAT repeat protein